MGLASIRIGGLVELLLLGCAGRVEVTAAAGGTVTATCTNSSGDCTLELQAALVSSFCALPPYDLHIMAPSLHA